MQGPYQTLSPLYHQVAQRITRFQIQAEEPRVGDMTQLEWGISPIPTPSLLWLGQSERTFRGEVSILPLIWGGAFPWEAESLTGPGGFCIGKWMGAFCCELSE